MRWPDRADPGWGLAASGPVAVLWGNRGSVQPYLGIGQGIEDIDEGQQGAVDVGTLPQPLPLGVGAGRPLRASQVNQAHLGHLKGLGQAWNPVLLLHEDLWGQRAGMRAGSRASGALSSGFTQDPSHLEDGMGAGGSGVGVSGVLCAVTVPPGQHLQQLLG